MGVQLVKLRWIIVHPTWNGIRESFSPKLRLKLVKTENGTLAKRWNTLIGILDGRKLQLFNVIGREEPTLSIVLLRSLMGKWVNNCRLALRKVLQDSRSSPVKLVY